VIRDLSWRILKIADGQVVFFPLRYIEPVILISAAGTPAVALNMKEEVLERTIDLGTYADGQQLQEIGPEMIKQELQRMGIKCGGFLEERANRLFSTKGITTKAQIKKTFLQSRQRRHPLPNGTSALTVESHSLIVE
jgi:hypothetical protein